jgi:hypothetical protein
MWTCLSFQSRQRRYFGHLEGSDAKRLQQPGWRRHDAHIVGSLWRESGRSAPLGGTGVSTSPERTSVSKDSINCEKSCLPNEDPIVILRIYKACSKKDRTFTIKTLFYILSTVSFKVVPTTGDTPFPTFLPLLECFLERTLCDGAQLSYRIFLNLRMLKKKAELFK